MELKCVWRKSSTDGIGGHFEQPLRCAERSCPGIFRNASPLCENFMGRKLGAVIVVAKSGEGRRLVPYERKIQMAGM